jgi:hypothetical protein
MPEEIDLSHEYTSSQIAATKIFYEQMIPRFNCRPELDKEYKELSEWLRRTAARDNKIIIDITAIEKRYLGDIVAAALVEGITSVYTFQLAVRENHQHPWKTLIHNLLGIAGISNDDSTINNKSNQREAYAYVNILDTEIYRQYRRAVLIRAPHIKVAVSVAAGSLIAAGIAALFANSDSVAFRVFSFVTGAASLIALVLVFLPPRQH